MDIEGTFRDFADKRADKLLQTSAMSKKIRALRNRCHLTQAEVAKRMGVTEAAVRNYELMKALPKEEHIQKLAAAFGVRPECLHLYDFSAGSILANALFQLGETYGLLPYKDIRFAALVPDNAFMERFLKEWASQYELLKQGVLSRERYELWKDSFYNDFNPCDFPDRFASEDGGITYSLIEPWEPYCFGSKLLTLRNQRGETQGEFASSLGLSEGVYRSYERGRRLPRVSALTEIASSLGITRGALTFFNYGTPVQAAHAMFQLAAERALVPAIIDGRPMLRTVRAGIERELDQWSDALSGVYESTGRDETFSFQEWKDKYDPNGLISSRANRESADPIWQSRCKSYSIKTEQGNYKIVDVESAFDPYDDRFKDGFLRA